jgi:small subunit ribosomal protein S8
MVTDPISDYLTRIRNAQMAKHRMVVIPGSKMKRKMTEILYDQGFISKYKFEEDDKSGQIFIALKYNPTTNLPIIRSMKRVSKPGLRQYFPVEDLPRVINGLGIAIVSTSKGVMTDKEARKENVGGEVLCFVY